MYDVCNTDPKGHQYCPVNHAAKPYPLDSASLVTLKNHCPHLMEHMRDGKLDLCCNPKMVSKVAKEGGWGQSEN